MDQVNIMVGGPESSLPTDIYKVSKNEKSLWIGVDHGAIRLVKNGIIPFLAIGDFDSVSEAEWTLLKEEVKDVRSFPSEKDDTDTELAIQLALELFPEAEIAVYGATAGRMDHLLSNLLLVFQPRFKKHASKIHLYDHVNSLSFYLPGNYTIAQEADKNYVAFICMTPVKKLSLVDLKYPLDKVDFDYPISLASNEFIGQNASFSFTEGLIAVVQSKD